MSDANRLAELWGLNSQLMQRIAELEARPTHPPDGAIDVDRMLVERDARIAEMELEKDSLIRQNVSLAQDCGSLRRQLADALRERDELRAAHDSVPGGVGIDDDGPAVSGDEGGE